MENPILEQEIADIEQRLAEKKAELNKEEVHSVVREQAQEKVPEYQPSTLPVPVANSQPPDISPELKDQIQELVNLAFTKSIEDAVKAASKLNNPALIDAFHDTLVDQLYDTLVERGKLKKM